MKCDYNNIDELLNATEGENCEFKEAKNKFGFQEALRYCCAISNCGGGYLVLGVTDKRPRQIVGTQAFEQPEQTRNSLRDKLRIGVDFQIFEVDGKRVLVFEVASRPIGLDIRADGVPWWREGESLVRMPSKIIRDIYNEIGHDFSADICHGATIQDLDIGAIEAFRSRWAERSGNEQIKKLSIEQILMDSEAVSDDGVTYAALILFGTRPALGKYLAQSEVIFEYRSSEAAGPAQHREEFRIGFFSFFDRVWDLINLRNDEQHYQDGPYVLGIRTFNERVVREALLNAVSHRDYQLGGSVFFRQYRDKLVVESPGGFPRGITLDNILHRQFPRNRRIAEIFARAGLVERSGQGMNFIYAMSVREAKPLPDFSGTDDYFVCMTLNGMIVDEKMPLVIKEIGEERLNLLTADDFLVIDRLYNGRKISDELQPRIKGLIELGIVERVGSNKLVLARGIYEETGKAGVYTRLVGLDRETNKELILKHIRDNGENGAPFRELQQVLPGHSTRQIKYLLEELAKEDKIRMTGKLKGARWHLA